MLVLGRFPWLAIDVVHLCKAASSTRPSLREMQYCPAMLGTPFPDPLYLLCISSTVRVSPAYSSMFFRPLLKMIALFSLFSRFSGSPLVANSPVDRFLLICDTNNCAHGLP